MNTIDAAETFARIAHAGQVRKWTGESYAAHPARVVGLLQQLVPPVTPDMMAAAWLHDVVEDTTVTIEAIGERFGPVVRFLVDDLTAPNQVVSVSGMIIKACDLIDNLGNIAEVAPPDEARAYLIKKGEQVARISETLREPYPALIDALAGAWYRNYQAVREALDI